MTSKERLLAAARGDMPDRLPYAPRMVNWWIANMTRNTLPEKYRDFSLTEILDDMGVDHHWYDAHMKTRDISQYYDLTSDDYAIRRGLGLYRSQPPTPYRQEFNNIDFKVIRRGADTIVEYHTPLGSVSSRMFASEELYRSGITDAYLSEEVIKEEKDYKPVGHIFRNIKVYPDYEPFRKFQESLGNKSLAFPSSLLPGSPMHHIQHDLMNTSQFFLELYDHPKQLKKLVEDMTPYYDAVMSTMANSTAEVVYYGANFHEMITYPPFFKEHILPWIQKYADWVHANGKLLACHCDGENHKLLDLYVDSGMDIADSIGCAPMFKSTVTELRKAFKGKITIFGAIPSVILLEESFSDDDFEKFMEQLFRDIVPGDRIILGVSDCAPSGAKFERLMRIQEMIAEKGTLPLS